MKQRIISILLFLFIVASNLAFANDHVKVVVSKRARLEYHDHETYEVWYDTRTKNPAFVIWDLTFEDVTLSEAASNNRSSNFTTCKNTATSQDYLNSGYDRGHMCPNNDRDWDKDSAANTFRMCNVCPQTPALNRGAWKTHESRMHDLARKYQLITIIAGPIYSTNKSISFIEDDKNKVAIPDMFFRLVIVDGNILEIFLFDQEGNEAIECSVEDLERLTNYQFKSP